MASIDISPAGTSPSRTTTMLTLTLAALAAGAAGTSIDWRLKGAIPPVRSQGQMGSAAAYATVDVSFFRDYLIRLLLPNTTHLGRGSGSHPRAIP